MQKRPELLFKTCNLIANCFLFSDCISRYMNCVIFHMIHGAVKPSILCSAVSHYYASIEVPQHLTAIQNLHKALLQYVSYWLPGSQQQDLFGFLKVLDGIYFLSLPLWENTLIPFLLAIII